MSEEFYTLKKEIEDTIYLNSTDMGTLILKSAKYTRKKLIEFAEYCNIEISKTDKENIIHQIIARLIGYKITYNIITGAKL